MQNKPSNDQHKSIYYRLRRSDPHERLSARLRHFSFGAAVFFVVAAAGIVTHSLYNIQIKQGATFRQYAAQQQLLDSTIQATRGECYYYARGNGSKNLERMRMRTPTSQNLAGMTVALKGCDLADVNMIILTIDPCISCTER